jgi:hypothetical protein
MFLGHGLHQPHTGAHAALSMSPESEELDGPETDGGADDSLEDGALKERGYMRERLRAELDREPTEEELNDWLRQHTEGY